MRITVICKKITRTLRFSQIGAFCLLLSATAGLFCVKPTQPPPQPPSVTSQGVDAIKQLDASCKALRAYYDINALIEPFDFGALLQDSQSLDIDFWRPSLVSAAVAHGLAKAGKTQAPMGLYARALAMSASDAPGAPLMQMPSYGPELLDSLDTPAHGSLVAVRIVLPETFWESAWDSVFGVVTIDTIAAETSLVINTVKQFRSFDTSSVRIEDLIVFDMASQKVDRRSQRHLRGGDTVYTHGAQFADPHVYDTISIDEDTAYVIVATRKDDHADSWNSLNSSALVSYVDSASLPQSAYTVRRLSDTSGNAQSEFFSFKTEKPQLIRMIEERSFSVADPLVSSRRNLYQRWYPDSAATLLSYSREDRYRDNSKASYEIKPRDSDNFDMKAVHSYASERATVFGGASKTVYHYRLKHNNWDSIQFVALKRVDSLLAPFGASDVFSHSDWSWLPPAPVAFGVTNADMRGFMEVRLYYPYGEQTGQRRWSRLDTARTVRYTRTWAGNKKGDTLHLIADSVDGGYNYRSYYRTAPQKAFVRKGRWRSSGDSIIVNDTMSGEARIISASMHKATRNGIIRIGDIMRINVSDESLTAVSLDQQNGPPMKNVEWRREGEEFIAAFNNAEISGGGAFRLDASGFIIGAQALVRADVGRAIIVDFVSVDPLYRGSAKMVGGFENVQEEDDISVTIDTTTFTAPSIPWGDLSIRLWERICLSSGQCWY